MDFGGCEGKLVNLKELGYFCCRVNFVLLVVRHRRIAVSSAEKMENEFRSLNEKMTGFSGVGLSIRPCNIRCSSDIFEIFLDVSGGRRCLF